MSCEKQDADEALHCGSGRKERSEGISSDDLVAQYYRDVTDQNGGWLLSQEEEGDLGRRVRNGDLEARAQLIRKNLALVIKIAMRYQGRGLSLLDLIQEGNMGLIRTMETFDPDRGRLTTHATHWINHTIRLALKQQTSGVRIPRYMHDLRVVYQEAMSRLRQERAAPSAPLEDIADKLGWSLKKTQNVYDAYRLTYETRSLADISPELEPQMRKDEETQPEKAVEQHLLREKLENALQCLSERELAIIRMRYGFDDHGPSSLKEIAEKFKVTYQRVKQIEKKALKKLRGIL